MTQKDFGTMDPAVETGSVLASDLNDFRDAQNSLHSGATPPSYLTAEMMWLDTSATPWLLKIYDGADHIVIGRVDATANTYIPAGTDATTTLSGPSELATAAEVNTGADAGRPVTPSTLASWNQGMVQGTSTTITNSTTPIVVTGLTKTISGSNDFAVDIFIELDQAATGADLKIGLVSGAGSTGLGTMTNSTLVSFESTGQGVFTSSAGIVNFTTPVENNQQITGRFIVNRGSGTALTVYFAQKTAVAANTTIAKSWMRVTELT